MKVPGWCAVGILIVISFQPGPWGQSTSDLRGELTQAAHGDSAARQAELRTFALAHDGDAQRGRELFHNEQRVGCSKCHRVEGTIRSVGPNLFAVGNKFERPELITSILEPSQVIAIGYGTTQVVTKEGQVHQGILQRVTNGWIELLDKDNKPVRINTEDIDEQQESSVSMMPAGIHSSLAPAEFADLIAYLSSLKQTSAEGQPHGVSNVIPQASSQLTLIPAFGTITFSHPVWMGQVPTPEVSKPCQNETRFIVLEQAGRAFLIRADGDQWTKDLLFDLSRSIRAGGATGLLGMAFHPQFAQNQRYFIKYQIIEQGRIQTVVEERRFRFPSTDDSDSTPLRLLTIGAVTQDHNGGCLTFGPDGFLYIGMGDSGPQTDPQGHGQDLTTLLGKILRIDVNDKQGDLPYAIPSDNPFRHDPTARHEIWAYGFREPWRFSFDSKTKELWVGDVGQNRIEEVAIVRAGENHGWNVYEGHAEHSPAFRRAEASYVAPVFSYPRSQGVSITGGYVYRGSKTPGMSGWYIAGDFESRRIWALREKDRVLTDLVEIGRAPTRVVSFTADHEGELFLLGFDSGVIYRMVLDSIDVTPLKSRALAETSQDGPVLWRYTTVEPPANWMNADFDDSSWKIGPGGFGTAGTPGAIVRTDWNSRQIWLRRSFRPPATIAPSSTVRISIHHDEDVEVYLNGVEAFRGMRWTSSYVESPISQEAADSLRSDRNVIAIHCRQTGGGQYIDAGLVEYFAAQGPVQ